MNTPNPITTDTEPMFSAIANRYDRFNHLSTLGLDYYWRKKTAALACCKPIAAALDICCGTGDMAFALADSGNVKAVCGCDISRPMLDIAIQKTHRRRADKHCPAFNWHCAAAEQTGLQSESFDVVTCAFGLRNIGDRAAALAEMVRLLKPGGTAAILEFSMPANPLIRTLYGWHLRYSMPAAGSLILGQTNPLIYLAASIEQWSKEIDLPRLMRSAGFVSITSTPLTFGIVTITTGTKCSS